MPEVALVQAKALAVAVTAAAEAGKRRASTGLALATTPAETGRGKQQM